MGEGRSAVAAYFAKATKARKASTVAEAMVDKMVDKRLIYYAVMRSRRR
jgi:hypothetical protein